MVNTTNIVMIPIRLSLLLKFIKMIKDFRHGEKNYYKK